MGKLQKMSFRFLFVAGAVGLVGGVATVNASENANMVLTSNQISSSHFGSEQVRAASNILPQNTEGSQNWAGYIDTPTAAQTGYTQVTGSWVVPTMTASQDGAAAQWIGLGGSSNQDLLQIGTTEQVTNGQAQAEIFWEKLPSVAQNVMTVPVGSTISANIAEGQASTWNLTVNVTTPSGQTESKTIPVTLTSAYAAGIGTSAEWISEDPSDGNNQLYPLANAGTVNFTNATVNGQALAAQTNQVQPTAMVDGAGNLLISPSSVQADGESFSTTTNTTPSPAQQSVSSGFPSGQTYPQSGRHHGRHGWGDRDWQQYGSGQSSGAGFGQGYSQGVGYLSIPFDGGQVYIYWQ